MSVRQTVGELLEVSSLKAIRAAIDRLLKQAPINKLWSIVGDYEFEKANYTLNAARKREKLAQFLKNSRQLFSRI